MRRPGPILATVLVLLATRVALLLLSVGPVTFLDTEGYFVSAEAIGTGDPGSYNFQRTPVYPLLVLAAGMRPDVVVLLQMASSLVTAAALCLITLRVTRSRTLALAGGVFYALLLDVMSFDCSLLSESIAATFCTLSFAAYLRAAEKPGPARLLPLAAVTALAALTRPVLLTLIPSYAVLIALMRRPDAGRGRWMTGSVLFTVSASLPILGWMLVVLARTSLFAVTTSVPYNLTNLTGAFVEHASDRFEPIRDVYLAYREDYGTHRMTVYRAAEEMRSASGLTGPEFERELLAMSFSAIAARPDLYLREAAVSWIHNWKVVNPEPAFVAALPGPAVAWSAVADAEKYALATLTLLVLLTAAGRLAGRRARRVLSPLMPLHAVILPYSLLTALSESPNPRYLLPMIPLLIAAGIEALSILSAMLRARSGSRPAGEGVS